MEDVPICSWRSSVLNVYKTCWSRVGCPGTITDLPLFDADNDEASFTAPNVDSCIHMSTPLICSVGSKCPIGGKYVRVLQNLGLLNCWVAASKHCSFVDAVPIFNHGPIE
jgi:hypothetical protein